MARTRLINPAATHDEDVATMSIWARYVWAYLPCFADRDGRLRDSAFTLKGLIFPADDVDVEAVLRELDDKKHIIRYELAGRRFIQIRNFDKYQSPHKNESASTIPPPTGGESTPSEPEKFVYFVRNTASGLIKIGSSTRPALRLDTLQTGCPDRLELIGVVRGGRAKETDLHAEFAGHRRSGEWFFPDERLVDFIELEDLAELRESLMKSNEPLRLTRSHPVSDPVIDPVPGISPSACDPSASEQVAAAPMAIQEAAAAVFEEDDEAPPVYGPPISPPPERRQFHLAAKTSAFKAVYDRYPRKDAEARAAQEFQEIAVSYPGGEGALSKAILAVFDAGMLKRHPYNGPNDKRPYLETMLHERRWEDAPSAPDDPPAVRAGPGPPRAPAPAYTRLTRESSR